MAKISVLIDVDEERVKSVSGKEYLEDAITRELDWLRDSGMQVEAWEMVEKEQNKLSQENGMYTKKDIEEVARDLVEKINEELDEDSREFTMEDAINGIEIMMKTGTMTYEQIIEEMKYNPDGIFGWIVEATEISDKISSNSIISVCVMQDTFYMVEKLDDYFSISYIDILPENFEPESIRKFLEEHRNDGESFSGDYKDVIQKLNELKEKKTNHTGFETPINIHKLQEYLAKDMILEFESPEECMNYFNTYDYQNFKTVEEMKQYQAEYGFGVGEKWYHINFDEALDVHEYIGWTVFEKNGVYTIGGTNNSEFDDCSLENLTPKIDERKMVEWCRAHEVCVEFCDLHGDRENLSYEAYLKHLSRYQTEKDNSFVDDEFIVPVVRFDSMRKAYEFMSWLEKRLGELEKSFFVEKTAQGDWACKVGADSNGILLVQEQNYPVELYYTRLDLNGSSILEREVLENRNDLLKAMQWHGQCNHVIEQIWDFDLKTCNSHLYVFFEEVYGKAMQNIEMAQCHDDIDDKETSSLDDKIQDATKSSRKNISADKGIDMNYELSSKDMEK